MKARPSLPRCFCALNALPSMRVFRPCRVTKIPACQARGIYVQSKALRDENSSVEKLSRTRSGEIVGCGGAAAASQLGLARQLTVRARMLEFGARSTGDPLLRPSTNFVRSNWRRKRWGKIGAISRPVITRVPMRGRSRAQQYPDLVIFSKGCGYNNRESASC